MTSKSQSVKELRVCCGCVASVGLEEQPLQIRAPVDEDVGPVQTLQTLPHYDTKSGRARGLCKVVQSSAKSPIQGANFERCWGVSCGRWPTRSSMTSLVAMGSRRPASRRSFARSNS